MGAVIKSVNRAYDRVDEAVLAHAADRVVLVCLTGLVLAGLLLLIVFGGPLGTAIADKAGLGGAFELSGDLPLADRVPRDHPLLLARLLPRAERRRAQLGVASCPAR